MPYRSRNHIFKDKYFKLRYDEPCRTITAHMRFDCNMYIHPEQPRGLTVREAARVQGFPDDYAFAGTFQRLYQQVGNAVPPPMAQDIAVAIKRSLDSDNGHPTRPTANRNAKVSAPS
jgi:DNA (cytosine-5)-methyltransferase 1